MPLRRRMRPGAGKAKGASFERFVCKQLSLWVSKGEREDIFWRSAMSGGRATVQRGKGKRNATQVGDISAVDPMGAWLINHFAVECKVYRDLEIDKFIIKGTGKLAEFWRETEQLVVLPREPLLIAKQNGLPVFILVTAGGIAKLQLEGEYRLWSTGLIALYRFEALQSACLSGPL